MNPVWYDDDSDQVWMTTGGLLAPFPPRTLKAVVLDGGMIAVRRRWGEDANLIAAPFNEIGRRDGSTFAATDEAKDYLDAVFSRSANRAMSQAAAAVPLGGHRVVRAGSGGVEYASSDDGNSAEAVLGITTGAVDAGEMPDILRAGTLREAAWAWVQGPIYLGLDGLLTQTAPSRGAVLQIASAVTATEIFVAIQEPYHLAS